MTVKELNTKIKSHSRYWLIAAVVGLILFIILFVAVFKPGNSYDSQIRTLDSVLKYQQKNIESLQKFNALQDSAIRTLDEAYKNNRPIETRIIREYEKLPDIINSLDREQLRREVANY